MKYQNIVPATFLARPNRFIATVEVDGQAAVAHVKNTGRCQELLVPGAQVYLYESSNPQRKTKYDLIAVYKGDMLVNMDSQVVNDVAEEYLRRVYPQAKIRREVTYKASRFDFYIENGEDKIFIEAKGVTLENEGVVSFPDAPTERGVKHVNELISAKKEGYLCGILFIIQMKNVKYFTPNDERHPAFGEALRQARAQGVSVTAVSCRVTPDTIVPYNEVEVHL